MSIITAEADISILYQKNMFQIESREISNHNLA